MARILGIDEVGRGPLAGPLVVGAVILPEWTRQGDIYSPEWVGELKDSKKLTAKKREQLNEIILREALATGLGCVTPREIDEIGISEALRLATRRAVTAAQQAKIPFNQIVIDGKINFLSDTKLGQYVSTMVKADDLIKEVSAASIIAKVARDRYMTEIAAQYPDYGFDKHVGYGTVAHRQAIAKFGVCPEHRRSFEPCRSLTGFEPPQHHPAKNTTSLGQHGEDAVSEFLISHDHQIVARNFKTYFCEVDIISIKDDKIYFTEVKYRKTASHGGGLAAITRDKQDQMHFAAETFLKFHPEFASFDPLLAAASVAGADFVVENWFPLV